MSKTFLPLYISAKIIKIDRDFRKLWSQMYCHLFLWFTVYYEYEGYFRIQASTLASKTHSLEDDKNSFSIPFYLDIGLILGLLNLLTSIHNVG